MQNKATVIACVNQKGGTGKTCTAENLGIGMVQEGKKVLLVDMDPQATLQGDPLAFLLASAPDAPFVGMESDHWIIGGE